MLRRLWNWLSGDRIRSSPADGMWLSLELPAIVLWDGERIEVLRRREIPTDGGTAICLECLTPRGKENLIIRPGDLHHPPVCQWTSSSDP